MATEVVMNEMYKEKIERKVYNKSFADTFIGRKVIEESVPKFFDVIHGFMDEDDFLSDFISSRDENELNEFAYVVIEYIVSGLVVKLNASGEKSTKPKQIRYAMANKIIEDVFQVDKCEITDVAAMRVFEAALLALDNFVATSKTTSEGGKFSLDYDFKDEYLELLIRDIDTISNGGLYCLPMNEKPLDWTVKLDSKGKVVVSGGYRTKQEQLIRGGKIDMPKNAFSPYDLVNNKKPLDALNIIQSVPYRINKSVLAEAKKNIPDKPVRPKSDDKIKQWFRVCDKFYEMYPTKEDRANAGKSFLKKPKYVLVYEADVASYKTKIGKLIGLKLAVKLADLHADDNEIYFPHNFDYRGRMYPLASSLTPQGDDISKGLLEFARPVKLTPDGMKCTIAYLASVYGHDKEPFDKRFEIGLKLMSDNSIDYRNAEEPYVFFQVKSFLDNVMSSNNPLDVDCHLALAIDGSCNGLQHMAAITMDKVGGSYVNVGDSAPRQDIYIEIANESSKLISDRVSCVHESLKSSNDENIINELLDEKRLLNLAYKFMSGNKARKIAKRPVMINPYGGTFQGYKEYVLQSLQEYYPDHSDTETAAFVTKYISDAMTSKLSGGAAYQEWVRTVFSNIAKLGIMPNFATPDGFTVRNHSYKTKETKKHMKSLITMSGDRKFSVIEVSNEINSRKIGGRAQPNVIHALDATHLRMTALACIDEGIENLWFIHDSFATDPNNYMKLNRITREQFIKLYDPNSDTHPVKVIMATLNKQLQDAGIEYEIPKFPVFTGDKRLDLESVINNEFFFA